MSAETTYKVAELFTELAKGILNFIVNGTEIVIHNPTIHFLKNSKKKPLLCKNTSINIYWKVYYIINNCYKRFSLEQL